MTFFSRIIAFSLLSISVFTQNILAETFCHYTEDPLCNQTCKPCCERVYSQCALVGASLLSGVVGYYLGHDRHKKDYTRRSLPCPCIDEGETLQFHWDFNNLDDCLSDPSSVVPIIIFPNGMIKEGPAFDDDILNQIQWWVLTVPNPQIGLYQVGFRTDNPVDDVTDLVIGIDIESSRLGNIVLVPYPTSLPFPPGTHLVLYDFNYP